MTFDIIKKDQLEIIRLSTKKSQKQFKAPNSPGAGRSYKARRKVTNTPDWSVSQ